MKFRSILILSVLIALGYYFSSKLFGTQEETKELKDIRSALDIQVANMACVHEGPFPFSSVDRRNGYKCKKCDDLYRSGLLEKTVDEISTPMGSAYETRYELTDLGKSVYVEGSTDDLDEPDSHRFCFGKTRVHEIAKAIGPKTKNGLTYLNVRYTLVLENPHTYLNDPRAKNLGIDLPLGSSLLYPESHITAVTDPKTNSISFIPASEMMYLLNN